MPDETLSVGDLEIARRALLDIVEARAQRIIDSNLDEILSSDVLSSDIDFSEGGSISDESQPFDDVSEVLGSRRTLRGSATTLSFGTLYQDDIEAIKYKDTDEVTLHDGTTALFKDVCVIGHTCFLKTDKQVMIDDFTGEYVLTKNTSRYIMSISKDNKVKWGKTHSNNVQYVPYLVSQKLGIPEGYILDVSILDPTKFVENYKYGNFCDIDDPDLKTCNSVKYIRDYQNYKNFHRPKTLSEQFKLGEKSPSYTISEGIKYTFGIELEVSHGYIPAWKARMAPYNILCMRDGSINNGDGGPEYVTGVMTGDTGFKHLQEICLELSKRTKVNSTCGVHVHLGGLAFTNQFLVNSYILALLLEEQIFELLPSSRRNNSFCKRLKKLKLKIALDNSKDNIDLQESYNTLFAYISTDVASYPDRHANKLKQHPRGAKCGYDHGTPRYCWINYVPAMFNTRNNINGYSLELRNHSGTTNFVKVKNWTLLFMAFCKFTEEYPDKIVPGITIDEIIKTIFPKKYKSLMFYFNSRKKLFEESGQSESADELDEVKTIKQLISD